MIIVALALLLALARGDRVAEVNAPPADFGAPVSIQIPVLYDDRHVYTKPDVLKQGRVLGALVRGGALRIPLRSMFEQMGATVSWDPASNTASVFKAGAEVRVTVGKPEVVINGESRPLDVPPMMYRGAVLVPVRVISEGMGAYVQWVPDRRLVVVRYIPATPPPTEAPAPPPVPEETVAPPPPPPPEATASPGPVEDSTLQLYDSTHPEAGLRSGTYFGRYSYVLLSCGAGARNGAMLTSLFEQYAGQGESVVLGRAVDVRRYDPLQCVRNARTGRCICSDRSSGIDRTPSDGRRVRVRLERSSGH
jgi:hypothetical protein